MTEPDRLPNHEIAEFAAYAAELLGELRDLARGQRLCFLQFLLDMACEEAGAVEKTFGGRAVEEGPQGGDPTE